MARQPAQHVVEWAKALERIRTIAAARAADRPGMLAVIGVTGAAGAGKSSLARLVSACVVATDDYLQDYEGLEPSRRDLPEMSDLSRLAADLRSLREGRRTLVPVWSFHSHRRETERELDPPAAPGVIVCEGLHALHGAVSSLLDVRVFVDAGPAERWRRIEARELAGERGWGVELSRRHFHEVAEPTFAQYAAQYRGRADVVVVNG